MARRTALRAVALSGVLALALSACGEDEPRPLEPAITSTEAAKPPSATPEQLASVVAGEEAAWREVIDGAFDCRFSWTLGGETPIDEANQTSCYLREIAVGLTARTVMDSLAELQAPDSMTALVDETSVALRQVVDVNLEASCGRAFVGPKSTPRCQTALGQRMWAYRSLEVALDQWAPYL